MSDRKPRELYSGDGMPTKFEATGPHYCPEGCFSVVYVNQKPLTRRVQVHLLEIDNDGRDIAKCPRCGKLFAYHYRVSKIVTLRPSAWKPGLDL